VHGIENGHPQSDKEHGLVEFSGADVSTELITKVTMAGLAFVESLGGGIEDVSQVSLTDWARIRDRHRLREEVNAWQTVWEVVVMFKPQSPLDEIGVGIKVYLDNNAKVLTNEILKRPAFLSAQPPN
jgi:hypothetical protein